MGTYIYKWDSINKKKVYGGKRELVTPRGQGYFGNNEAGNTPEFVPKDWGDDVGFKGSSVKEYPFFNASRGMHTVVAHSYEEALRIAKSMGFTAADYKPKHKRGRR